MIDEVEKALSRLSGETSDRDYVRQCISLLERENRTLTDDNEVKCSLIDSMKRRIYGLEQTVANCKEKEEKLYRSYYWPHEE